MKFKKYQSLVRYGTTNVEGIEKGECVIFPKLDGTNSSCWLDDQGQLQAGSRKRHLTLDNDNAGFYRDILEDKDILAYLKKHPTHRLFGEWLVPHSLKTYKDGAWRKFYVFDVCIDLHDTDENVKYIPYKEYKFLLDEFNINYIPPLATINNGSYDEFIKHLEVNDFLIEEGKGVGEGIVIKNYKFFNKFGKQTWAKIITSEFKNKINSSKEKDVNKVYCNVIEENIVNDFFTEAFIEKEFAKFVLEHDGFESKNIPKFLGVIWYEFINEESWNIIKKYKNPTINYKVLNGLSIRKIKEVKHEFF